MPTIRVAADAHRAAGWRGRRLARRDRTKSKTGRVFPSSLATSVVRDARGEVSAIVGVAARDHARKTGRGCPSRVRGEVLQGVRSQPGCHRHHGLRNRRSMMVNEAFERITGYCPIGGHRPDDARSSGCSSTRTSCDAIERLRQPERRRDVEFQIRRKSGEVSTILAIGRDHRDRRQTVLSHGQPGHHRAEAVRAAPASGRRAQQAAADGNGSRGAVAVAVIESVHKILPLDYASLVLYEPDSRTLRLKAQRGLLDAEPLHERGPGAGGRSR